MPSTHRVRKTGRKFRKSCGPRVRLYASSGFPVSQMIGDASGHGLPAALLVRDIVTGLRMGLEKHLRMEYVFSKLNRVIHRSNLSSRFISVFYGELESNGNLSFVNAGHQPPLLFRKDRVLELRTGGTVIGALMKMSCTSGRLSA